MKSLEQIDFRNKKVFLRADLNVPFDENGEIADDTRIKAALKTTSYLLQKGASVTLASHLGRPKGQVNEKYSLKPIVKRIEEILEKDVMFIDDCVGPAAEKNRFHSRPGQVILLENLRFHPQEEENDPYFAAQLAKNADVYVNDAFGTAHRAHASTVGITAHVKEKAAGLTLQKEIDYFNSAFNKPKKPCAIIFGGAKISTKLAAIKNAAKKADVIFVGGAMANTFLAADGLDVGKSLVEPELIDTAKSIMKQLSNSNCQLVLPTDVIVAEELKSGVETLAVDVNEIPENTMALDIGPKTVREFMKRLYEMKTIIWNGPMGAFETEEFSKGTYSIVDALARSEALTVVGGGDTDLALHKCDAVSKMSYVSTGGGAFLELLEGKTLPAVEALG